jgi:hypothetical protein
LKLARFLPARSQNFCRFLKAPSLTFDFDSRVGMMIALGQRFAAASHVASASS